MIKKILVKSSGKKAEAQTDSSGLSMKKNNGSKQLSLVSKIIVTIANGIKSDQLTEKALQTEQAKIENMPLSADVPKAGFAFAPREGIPSAQDKTEDAKPKQKKSSKFYFLRLSIKDKISLAKRLAILLKAGVPILQSVRMLKEQIHSKTVNHILDVLVEDVESGKYIHTSLSVFQKVFGDFFINLIRIGEISGTLHENLKYLAEELQKKQALRRKVISALVYPVFIVLATLGITVLLTVYVFPKILPIIRGFTTELPFTTRVLVFVSNFFINYWYICILAAVALVLGFYFAIKNNKFKLKFDRFTVRLPLLGKIFQGYHVANICRSFGVLLKSDVRIVEAVNITAKTTTNLAYREKLLELAQALTRGEKAASVFVLDKKLFPAVVHQMVLVGETTGHLSESLLYLAEIYEAEVDDLTKNLSTVLEPLLMVFMGFLVGFVAISIITPIYSLSQNLHP